MKKALSALVVSIMLCSCSDPEPTFDKSLVEEEVREMLDRYHEAMREEGLLSEEKFLDNSEDFFWVPPGYENPIDYDSTWTTIEQNALAIKLIDLHWESLDVKPLTPHLANFVGIVRGSVVDTTGTESKIKLIESGTLIKRESGWKLLSGQTSGLSWSVNQKVY